MKITNKKLATIVVVVTTVLVLSFAGCTATDKTPEVLPDDKVPEPEVLNDENVSEEDIADIPNEQEVDIVKYTGESMTFEEFCVGMKDDLSPEVLEEVRDIYERWIEAENDEDKERGADTIIELYEELVDLDVLTMEEQPSQAMLKPRP